MAIFKKCAHDNVTCLHGDAILIRWRRPYVARVRCLDCGKPLFAREMPDVCNTTGLIHELYVQARKRKS